MVSDKTELRIQGREKGMIDVRQTKSVELSPSTGRTDAASILLDQTLQKSNEDIDKIRVEKYSIFYKYKGSLLPF